MSSIQAGGTTADVTHEDTGTALSRRALATKTFDLAVGVDLVVLQDRHLDLLGFMLDLLGGLYAATRSASVRVR